MRIRNQWVIAAAVIAAAYTTASAQYAVFDDTFASGSTINGGNAPTANSTSYDTYNIKQITNNISANDLDLWMTPTGGGGAEFEALFTSTPYTLGVGDYLYLQISFINTFGIWNSGNGGSYLYEGLFNSGGVAPLTTNPAGGANTFVAGGVQNWLGYVAQFGASGTTSKIHTRAAQTQGVDQDLLGNNISSSNSYNSPSGIQLNNGASGTSGTMTSGGQYTETMLVTNMGSGLLGVQADLYGGFGTTGTAIVAMNSAYAGGVTNLTQTFDGMGIGWYEKGDFQTEMDVNDIIITSDIPEPSTLVLLGAGLAMLARLVWRRR